MTLNERLDSVEKGIKNINETLDPLLRSAETPTVSEYGSMNENAGILRKHVTLLSEWEAVQDESDVLREELKEDKWLTVFRTVTDQADGMMSSLEKAVNRCQVSTRGLIIFSHVFSTICRSSYGRSTGEASMISNQMLLSHLYGTRNRQ